MARPWDCRACSCSDPLTRHTHIYLVKNVYKCFVFWHGHVYFFLIVGLHPWEHICTTVQLCVTHSRFLTRQTLTLSKQLVEVLACVYASVFSPLYSCVRVYYNCGFWSNRTLLSFPLSVLRPSSARHQRDISTFFFIFITTPEGQARVQLAKINLN